MTSTCGFESCLHTSHATTHHQGVNVHREFVVAIRIVAAMRVSGMTEAGRAANGRLEQAPSWPHKSLVIKTCRQQRCEVVIDRQNIKLQTRPDIARTRYQPLVQVDVSGSRIGCAPSVVANFE